MRIKQNLTEPSLRLMSAGRVKRLCAYAVYHAELSRKSVDDGRGRVHDDTDYVKPLFAVGKSHSAHDVVAVIVKYGIDFFRAIVAFRYDSDKSNAVFFNICSPLCKILQIKNKLPLPSGEGRSIKQGNELQSFRYLLDCTLLCRQANLSD